jgi:hypothetical protein
MAAPGQPHLSAPHTTAQEAGARLDERDLASARLACRAWAELLLLGLQQLTLRQMEVAPIRALLARLSPSTAIKLAWTSARPPTRAQLQQALQALQASRHLRALAVDMPRGSWSQRGLQEPLTQALQQLGALHSFELRLVGPAGGREDPATPALLPAVLASLTGLRRLRLRDAPLPAQHLPLLPRLQQLQQLALSTCAAPQAALDALAGLASLQRLDLSFARLDASQAGAALVVPELPHLTALRLGRADSHAWPQPQRLALSEPQAERLLELQVAPLLALAPPPGGCAGQLGALSRLVLLGPGGGRAAPPLPPLPQLAELRGLRCSGAAARDELAQALAAAPRLQVCVCAAAPPHPLRLRLGLASGRGAWRNRSRSGRLSWPRCCQPCPAGLPDPPPIIPANRNPHPTPPLPRRRWP